MCVLAVLGVALRPSQVLKVYLPVEMPFKPPDPRALSIASPVGPDALVLSEGERRRLAGHIEKQQTSEDDRRTLQERLRQRISNERGRRLQQRKPK